MALTESQLRELQANQAAAKALDDGVKPVAQAKAKRGQNKTETEYEAVLEARKRAGEVLWYQFEAHRLRLANGAYFKPDYAVMVADGSTEYHECKGHWEEAARVRIRVAADRHPYRFVAVTKKRVKDGGGWTEEVFSAAFDRLKGTV